jgi:hypothetical protein
MRAVGICRYGSSCAPLCRAAAQDRRDCVFEASVEGVGLETVAGRGALAAGAAEQVMALADLVQHGAVDETAEPEPEQSRPAAAA